MKNSSSQAYALKRKKCVLCDSSHISALFKKNKYLMVKCRNCGVIYQMPQENKSNYLKNVQKHYSKVDPSFKVAYSRKILYKRFLNQVIHIKKKAARLLDIGCGMGYFLYLAKKDGWNVFGLELSPDLVKIGIQNFELYIQCGDFEESNFTDNYFDVITLWNVIDEFPDPLGCITKAKRILKPGGVLYMRTPNAAFHLFLYRIQQALKKLHLEHIMPYQSFIFHIFNFNKKTVNWIFNNNGFKNIRIKNSRPTAEDPYGVKKGIRGFKVFTFFMAQFVFFFSFGKLTVASSIEVFSENAEN